MTDNESLSVRVGTFLFKPEIFFRQLAETLPRYLLPLLIVLVTGIFSAVWTWLHLSWFFSFFSAGLSGTGPGSHQFSFIFDMVVISLSAYFLFDPLITVICAGLVFYILACFCVEERKPHSYDHRYQLGEYPARGFSCAVYSALSCIPARYECHGIAGVVCHYE